MVALLRAWAEDRVLEEIATKNTKEKGVLQNVDDEVEHLLLPKLSFFFCDLCVLCGYSPDNF